jgi:hypothetical protein
MTQIHTHDGIKIYPGTKKCGFKPAYIQSYS